MVISRTSRFLALLFLLSVGLLLAPNVGNAADPQTAQEKYDALVEAGIFDGFPDGQAHLDNNMTRAQAAKIVSLVLGLEENSELAHKTYKDLKDAEWAAGFIGAATEAGIMQGHGRGIFDPGSDVTTEQLAKIMVEALDLEVDASAKVEGASDWAQAYVAAAVAAGLIPEQADYTQPASRELLVAASYTAYDTVQTNQEAEKNKDEEDNKEEDKAEPVYVPPVVYNPPPLSISEIRQVDVNEFTVRFNQSLDPTNVRLSITKDGNPVVAEAVSVGNNQYRLILDGNVQDGQYVVGASYAGSSAIFSSASVTGSVERLVKIEFVQDSDSVAPSDRTGIEIRAINQFGHSMKAPPPLEVTSTVSAAIDSKHMAVILDTSSQTSQSIVSITVLETSSRISVTKAFKVGDAANVASMTFRGALRNASGNEVSTAVWGNAYHVNFDAYDQYGNLMYATAASPSLLHTPNSEFISVGSAVDASASEPGTFSIPVTFTMPITEQANLYTLQLTVGGASVQLSFTAEDTRAIQEVWLNTINDYYSGGAGSEPGTNSFAGAGVTGVTTSNLTAVKAALVADGQAPWTLAQLQAIVDAVANGGTEQAALDSINAAMASGEWSGVDETTFAAAGIIGVDNINVWGIQGNLQDDYAATPGPRTKADIQRFVNETIYINKINNYFVYGSDDDLVVEDFELAGLIGVTESNLSDLIAFLQPKYIGGGGGGGFPGGGFPDPGGGFPGGGGSGGSLYAGSSKAEVQAAINEFLGI